MFPLNKNIPERQTCFPFLPQLPTSYFQVPPTLLHPLLRSAKLVLLTSGLYLLLTSTQNYPHSSKILVYISRGCNYITISKLLWVCKFYRNPSFCMWAPCRVLWENPSRKRETPPSAGPYWLLRRSTVSFPAG